LGLRIGLFGDEIDELVTFDPLTGKEIRRHEQISIYPKSHFVTPRARRNEAVVSIKAEMGLWINRDLLMAANLFPGEGKEIRRHEQISIYPKSHFVTPRARRNEAVVSIKAELAQRLVELETAGRVA